MDLIDGTRKDLPRDSKWRDDFVSNFNALNLTAYFFDDARELMTHDESCRAWLVTTKDVKLTRFISHVPMLWGTIQNVRSAECCICDFDNDISLILDLRNRSILQRDLVWPIVDDRFHSTLTHWIVYSGWSEV
jgi:hypothetical protein